MTDVFLYLAFREVWQKFPYRWIFLKYFVFLLYDDDDDDDDDVGQLNFFRHWASRCKCIFRMEGNPDDKSSQVSNVIGCDGVGTCFLRS